ncbi:hypothetical protein QJS66_03835 [Kocuria rhizophila]|nr:hypothetical protein QJS66_03835 [Kocuria rhizophila]
MLSPRPVAAPEIVDLAEAVSAARGTAADVLRVAIAPRVARVDKEFTAGTPRRHRRRNRQTPPRTALPGQQDREGEDAVAPSPEVWDTTSTAPVHRGGGVREAGARRRPRCCRPPRTTTGAPDRERHGHRVRRLAAGLWAWWRTTRPGTARSALHAAGGEDAGAAARRGRPHPALPRIPGAALGRKRLAVERAGGLCTGAGPRLVRCHDDGTSTSWSSAPPDQHTRDVLLSCGPAAEPGRAVHRLRREPGGPAPREHGVGRAAGPGPDGAAQVLPADRGDLGLLQHGPRSARGRRAAAARGVPGWRAWPSRGNRARAGGPQGLRAGPRLP